MLASASEFVNGKDVGAIPAVPISIAHPSLVVEHTRTRKRKSGQPGLELRASGL